MERNWEISLKKGKGKPGEKMLFFLRRATIKDDDPSRKRKNPFQNATSKPRHLISTLIPCGLVAEEIPGRLPEKEGAQRNDGRSSRVLQER